MDLRVGCVIWEFQGNAASASNARSKLERHNDSLIAFAIVLLHQDRLKQFEDEGMRQGEKRRRAEMQKGKREKGHDKNILLAGKMMQNRRQKTENRVQRLGHCYRSETGLDDDV